MKTIGETIKELRKANGMSQRELADLIGTKKQTISHMENNQSSVKSDYVYAFCEIFECDANTLFGTKKLTGNEN